MKFVISSILFVCLAQMAFTAPVEQQRDLGNILNMFGHNNNNNGGAASSNLLGLLGSLTGNNTSLSTALQVLQLLNSLHQLEGNVAAIPQDLLHALNSTSSLITSQLNNLTSLIGPGKRDLGNILNMFGHNNNNNNGGAASSNLLGLLGSLTGNNTSLSTALQVLQLLNSLHQLEGNVAAIPQDLLHALNSTSSLITSQLNNLTSLIGPGKRDLLSDLFNSLPQNVQNTINNALISTFDQWNPLAGLPFVGKRDLSDLFDLLPQNVQNAIGNALGNLFEQWISPLANSHILMGGGKRDLSDLFDLLPQNVQNSILNALGNLFDQLNPLAGLHLLGKRDLSNLIDLLPQNVQNAIGNALVNLFDQWIAPLANSHILMGGGKRNVNELLANLPPNFVSNLLNNYVQEFVSVLSGLNYLLGRK